MLEYVNYVLIKRLRNLMPQSNSRLRKRHFNIFYQTDANLVVAQYKVLTSLSRRKCISRREHVSQYKKV